MLTIHHFKIIQRETWEEYNIEDVPYGKLIP